MRTEYYETIDYTWVVARQLDRVAESISRVNPRAPGLGVRQVFMAVRALGLLASPFVRLEETRQALGEAERLLGQNRVSEALRVLEELVARLLEELDKKGVLVRKSEYPVGVFGGVE